MLIFHEYLKKNNNKLELQFLYFFLSADWYGPDQYLIGISRYYSPNHWG